MSDEMYDNAEWRLSRELSLSRELAFALGEAATVEEALSIVLARVCETTGWNIGQAWLPSRTGETLECSPSWYADDWKRPGLQEFRRTSEQMLYAAGQGLPGYVWSSRRPLWVEDVAQKYRCVRTEAAVPVGIQAALGVPIMGRMENGRRAAIAVLEFFLYTPRPADEDLLDMVASVAAPLGQIIDRRYAEDACRRSESELQALLRAMEDVVLVLNSEGRYVKIATTNSSLLFRPAEEMMGRTFHELFPEADADYYLHHVRRALETRQTVKVEYSREAQGKTNWFAATISPMNNEQVVWVARDVTAYREALDAAKKAESKYRAIFENALEGIFQTATDGRFISANPALARIYGYASPQELMENLTNIGQQLYLEPKRRVEFQKILEENGSVSEFESQIRRTDGQVIWISENARAVYDENGELLYYEGTVEDISARKWQEAYQQQQQEELRQTNEQLRDMAMRDSLTRLNNRRALQIRLREEIARAARYQTPLSLMLLDIDHFKSYNDTLGHPAGDGALRQIGALLAQSARTTDFVARYGGEEFVILLPSTGSHGAVILAERFREAIQNARWPQRPVTASFGVATWEPRSEHSQTEYSKDEPHGDATSNGFHEHGENEGHENGVHGFTSASHGLQMLEHEAEVAETELDESAPRLRPREHFLLAAADRALYESKAQGRNRVTHVDEL